MTFKKILFLFVVFVASVGANMAQAQTSGKATYYGNKFHGRRTSDGSRYHKDSLTCAHKTLPFGTLLKVRNKANGKEVVVKVTDRGPFVAGRVVDLSLAAAKELNMVAQGVAKVEVTNLGHENELGASAHQLTAMVQSDESVDLTTPRFIDPATGKFYTMAEWKQRGEEAQKRHLAELKQKQQPRYKIMSEKLTAKNIKVQKHK